LGPYWYDFAVPKLRLLIELDSSTYHRGYRLARDHAKSRYAKESSWKLIRFRVSGDGDELLADRVFAYLDRREDELGI
jgi:very-short-patch-repair endonuclease